MPEDISFWDGQRLSNDPIAFEVFAKPDDSPYDVPAPIFATACSQISGKSAVGDACVLVPEQLSRFLCVHSDCEFVCHGAASLHEILTTYFQSKGNTQVQDVLWRLAGEYRLHDIGLIQQLLTYTSGEVSSYPQLPDLASEYSDSSLKGSDALPEQREKVKVQELTSQLLMEELATVGETILRIYQNLVEQIQTRFPDVNGNGRQFGFFGSGIDLQGAIAVESAQGNGLILDRDGRDRILNECKRVWQENASELLSVESAKHIFKKEAGKIKRSTTGFPNYKEEKLDEWLKERSNSLLDIHGLPLHYPSIRGTPNTERASTQTENWGIVTRCDRLSRCWHQLDTASRLAHTVRKHEEKDEQTIHPRYEIFPRTRSYGPNIEQLRKLAPGAFRPRADHRFLNVRLCDLEIRCFAAYCGSEFGESQLAKMLHDSDDRYRFVTKELESCGFVQRSAASWIQLAKGLLCAVPAGLGDLAVRGILKNEYDSDVSAKEMADFRNALGKILPELEKHFHSEDSFAITTRNLTGRTLPRGPFVRACCAKYIDVADAVMKAVVFAVHRKYKLVAIAGNEFVLEILQDKDMDVALVQEKVESITQQAAGRVLREMPVPCTLEWLERW